MQSNVNRNFTDTEEGKKAKAAAEAKAKANAGTDTDGTTKESQGKADNVTDGSEQQATPGN